MLWFSCYTEEISPLKESVIFPVDTFRHREIQGYKNGFHQQQIVFVLGDASGRTDV